MNAVVHSGQRGPWPELLDWLEGPIATVRPPGQMIRFEDYAENGRYVLRAELPGIEPQKDVEISISGRVLTVRGQRRAEQKDRYRAEFRYGPFARSITLPKRANEDDVTAVYDKGILEVTVGLRQPEPSERRIDVARKS
jgi:HSP20 family molecular chaperone IbpA